MEVKASGVSLDVPQSKGGVSQGQVVLSARGTDPSVLKGWLIQEAQPYVKRQLRVQTQPAISCEVSIGRIKEKIGSLDHVLAWLGEVALLIIGTRCI